MSPLSTIPKILFALAAFLDPSYTKGEMKMFESRYTLVTLNPLLLQQPLDVHFAVKLLREGAREVFYVALRGGLTLLIVTAPPFNLTVTSVPG